MSSAPPTERRPTGRGDERPLSVRLDGERVCFDPESGQLLVTNDVGADMWRGLLHGWSHERIAADIERRFAAPPERIRADLEGFVRQLGEALHERERLSGEFASTLEPIPPRPFRAARRVRWPLPELDAIIESEASAVVDGLERVLGRALEELPAPPETSGDDYPIRVWDEGGRFPISHVDRTIDVGLDLADAVHRLGRIGPRRSATRNGWTLAMHAAAVERDGRAIVLPAVSGAGKTTLVSWLVGRGRAKLVNDDHIVLRTRRLELAPAPCPLSIKDGSVALLESLWPVLPTLPVHRDRIGRRVRELGLSADLLSGQASEAVAVVVPKRHDTIPEATLSPVSRADTLRGMLANGLTLAPGAGWSDVLALTEWLAALPCFRLDYADLESAEGALERLWHASRHMR